MILLNLAEPLTPESLTTVASMHGSAPRSVINIAVDPNEDLPYTEQARAVVDRAGLTGRQWQISSLLVIPPDDPVMAAIVLSEMAGRRGRTPTVLRMRRSPAVGGSRSPAEIVNLHDVRRDARKARDE